MANILDTLRMSEPVIKPVIKMSEPVLSTASPGAEPELPPIEDVRDTVANFLKKMPDAKEVSITKLALMDCEKGTWEAEAEVYVPNPTIRALGLPVRKEVLDCQTYLLRLDKQLNIVAYGLRDSVMDREDIE